MTLVIMVFIFFLSQEGFSQLRGQAEIQLYNSDNSSHTYNASAEGRLIWFSYDETIPMTFYSNYETGVFNNMENSVTVPASSGGSGYGWDLQWDYTGFTGNGIMAYGMYKIWVTDTPSDYFYLDLWDEEVGYHLFYPIRQ